MQFFGDTTIDFLSSRKKFIIGSFIFSLMALIAALSVGIEYGIDFTGGTQINVRYNDGKINSQQIRNALGKAGISNIELKSYGAVNEFLIRVQDAGEDVSLSETVMAALRNDYTTQYPGVNVETSVEMLSVDAIGPKVGEELRQDAMVAIILSVLAISVYIAFRFEFVFGLGAIVALVHDIAIAFSLTVLFNKADIINLEINQSLIAAFLTVLGFSINNTVIIFDRFRENREQYKNEALVPLANRSINETLSRTVNTFLTTALALLTIVLFGGEVLQGFAFTMFIGFVAGTWTSVFVSSGFVVWIFESYKKVDVEGNNKSKSGKVSVAKV